MLTTLLLPALLLAPSSDNLLLNPSAETGDLSAWTDALGNGFNVDDGSVGNVPAVEGTFLFYAGAHQGLDAEIEQVVDLGSFAASIDAGSAQVFFSGWARSAQGGAVIDAARVILEYRDVSAAVLATFDSGVVQPSNQWKRVFDVRSLPPGTRSVRVRLRGTRPTGLSTEAYFDALLLRVSDFATRYCQANANSSGMPGRIDTFGSDVVADDCLYLVASQVPNTPGIFFHGGTRVQAPFGDGFRCTGGQIERVVPVVQAVGGVAQLQAPTSGITQGQTRHFQYWFRDQAAGAAGFNLTDAVEVAFN